jgi:hypothetical protein
MLNLVPPLQPEDGEAALRLCQRIVNQLTPEWRYWLLKRLTTHIEVGSVRQLPLPMSEHGCSEQQD